MIPESSFLPHTVKQVKKISEEVSYLLEQRQHDNSWTKNNVEKIFRDLHNHLVEMAEFKSFLNSTDHNVMEHSEDLNNLNERLLALQSWMNVTDADISLGQGFHNQDLQRAVDDMADRDVSLDDVLERSVPKGVLTQPGPPPTHMRRFQLIRDGDGCVAEGVEFADGSCAMSWVASPSSMDMYPSIKAVESIHGHDGLTAVIYLD